MSSDTPEEPRVFIQLSQNELLKEIGAQEGKIKMLSIMNEALQNAVKQQAAKIQELEKATAVEEPGEEDEDADDKPLAKSDAN